MPSVYRARMLTLLRNETAITPVVDMLSDDEYGGFLEKRGRSRNYSFSKSWAVKYVVVNIENSLLQYYDDPKEIGRGRYPKGQMQLSGAVLQRAAAEQGKVFVFEVTATKSTGETETLTFNALSADQLEHWMEIFDATIHNDRIENYDDYSEDITDESPRSANGAATGRRTSMTAIKDALTSSVKPFLSTSEVHDRVESATPNRITGYLYKRSRNTSTVSFSSKSWYARYCVITKSTAFLQYYESINDVSKGRKAKGEFLLKGASIYKLPPQDDQLYCFQISCRKANGETDEYQFHAINEKHYHIWLQFLSSVACTRVYDLATTKTDSRKPFSSASVSPRKQPLVQSSVSHGEGISNGSNQRLASTRDAKFKTKTYEVSSLPGQQNQLSFTAVDEISPIPNKRPAFAVLPTKVEQSKQSAPIPGHLVVEFPVFKESIILSRLLMESLEDRGRLAAIIEKLNDNDPSVLSTLSENEAILKLRGMTIELQRVVDQLVEMKVELSKEKQKREEVEKSLDEAEALLVEASEEINALKLQAKAPTSLTVSSVSFIPPKSPAALKQGRFGKGIASLEISSDSDSGTGDNSPSQGEQKVVQARRPRDEFTIISSPTSGEIQIIGKSQQSPSNVYEESNISPFSSSVRLDPDRRIRDQFVILSSPNSKDFKFVKNSSSSELPSPASASLSGKGIFRNADDKNTEKDTNQEIVLKLSPTKMTESVVIDIDLGDGPVESIIVYRDSDPQDLALKFISTHGLSPEYCTPLVAYINQVLCDFEEKAPTVEATKVSNPGVVIDIDVGDDLPALSLTVHKNSDPVVLARDFVKEHSLSEEFLEPLQEYIQETLNELLKPETSRCSFSADDGGPARKVDVEDENCRKLSEEREEIAKRKAVIQREIDLKNEEIELKRKLDAEAEEARKHALEKEQAAARKAEIEAKRKAESEKRALLALKKKQKEEEEAKRLEVEKQLAELEDQKQALMRQVHSNSTTSQFEGISVDVAFGDGKTESIVIYSDSDVWDLASAFITSRGFPAENIQPLADFLQQNQAQNFPMTDGPFYSPSTHGADMASPLSDDVEEGDEEKDDDDEDDDDDDDYIIPDIATFESPPTRGKSPSPSRNRSRTQSDVTVDAGDSPLIITTDLGSIEDNLDVYNQADRSQRRASLTQLHERVTQATVLTSPERKVLRPDSYYSSSSPAISPIPLPSAHSQQHRRFTESRRPSTLTTIQQSVHKLQAPSSMTSTQRQVVSSSFKDMLVSNVGQKPVLESISRRKSGIDSANHTAALSVSGVANFRSNTRAAGLTSDFRRIDDESAFDGHNMI